ncbi:hypothetical protein ACGF3G_49470 [Streptomyces sp. NPDC048179]|uniref:hypothetical protein n=1 Tax=Streptomyces sp. NPDC048179 TaxID=3365506 RepID=UPI00371371DF
MPHTNAAAVRKPRTARPTPGAPAPVRPATTAHVVPLWEAMALLFAPAKGTERP